MPTLEIVVASLVGARVRVRVRPVRVRVRLVGARVAGPLEGMALGREGGSAC